MFAVNVSRNTVDMSFSAQDLAKYTRMDPENRIKALTNFSRRITTNEKAKAEMSKWELALNPQLVQLGGRLLKPATIVTANRIEYDSFRGASWDECEFRLGLSGGVFLIASLSQSGRYPRSAV